MKKRILGLALAVALVCALLPTVALAAEDFQITDGVLIKYNGPGGNVVIPDSVTRIGGKAFTGRDDLTSVTIPNSVTSIRDFAFEGCTGLTSVTIPNSVNTIRDSAFKGCTGLTSVTIPSSVTLISGDPFRDCTGLTSVTIPVSVTRMDGNVFKACTGLTDVYYGGTKAQWYAIERGPYGLIHHSDDPLYFSSVTIHHNSAAAPAVPATPAVTPVPTDKSVYADVPTDAWYAEAVNAMTEGGLLTGYDDGLFHPDDTISVGQFATILCRIGGISTDNNEFKPHELLNVQYETPYDWAHMAIMNLHGHGKYNVEPNQADRLVVRGETITAMRKIAEVMPQYHENNDRSLPLRQLSEKIWTEADIPDWDEVMRANWDNQGPCILAVSIKTAYNLGITQGIDDIGTCNPYGTMTRAELCQMLYNMGITKANSVRYITGFIGM